MYSLHCGLFSLPSLPLVYMGKHIFAHCRNPLPYMNGIMQPAGILVHPLHHCSQGCASHGKRPHKAMHTTFISAPGFDEIGPSAAPIAASASPSAPVRFWRQGGRQQQSSLLPQCAHLHTTAGPMSIPSSPKALSQGPDSDAPRAAAAPSRQLPTPPQHLAAGLAGGHGLVDEADRDSGSHAVDAGKIVLYKGRYMRMFRMLVRFKIFQLVGIAALAVPINTFLAEVSLVKLCHHPPHPSLALENRHLQNRPCLLSPATKALCSMT